MTVRCIPFEEETDRPKILCGFSLHATQNRHYQNENPELGTHSREMNPFGFASESLALRKHRNCVLCNCCVHV